VARAGRGVRGNAQSVERRRERLPAARARRAFRSRDGGAPHRGVRTLQPRRRRLRRVRRARREHTRDRERHARPADARDVPGALRALRRARHRELAAVSPASHGARRAGAHPGRAAARFAAHRRGARRALQRRC
jgi:hypothetical protein